MRKLIIILMFLFSLNHIFPKGQAEPFHKTVDYVDMNRFSGDWFVIALIPTPFEKGASNGIENYSFDKDGNIKVKYTYSKGDPEPEKKTMYQKGWIINHQTNAEWRVQPLWPLKLPYYIMELAPDYSYTVIGTNNYKYLWIMARTPHLDKSILENIISRMVQKGFEREKIIMMKQKQ